jgi:hypothetical protein
MRLGLKPGVFKARIKLAEFIEKTRIIRKAFTSKFLEIINPVLYPVQRPS